MCSRNGGQLALIHELTTVPDMEIRNNRTFWVGIRWNGITIGNHMWSNWGSKPVLGNASVLCAFITVEPPYFWYATNCSSRHSYICEVQNGSCSYISFNGRALRGLNKAFRSGVTLNQCKQICDDGSLGFTCQSFEHSTRYNYCYFSEWNRWTAPEYFRSDPELDYYHRTCCQTILMNEDVHGTTTGLLETPSVPDDKDVHGTTTGLLETPSVPDDRTTSLEMSSDVFSSTDAIDTSSIPEISSSYPDVSHGPTVFCTQVWFDDQSHLVSQTFTSALLPSVTSVTVSEPPASTNLIDSLQDLSETIKNRKKLLKRISVPDNRVSSISIGTVALLLLVGLVVTIVVLDAPTLSRHCSALHRNLCHRSCRCSARTKYPAPSSDSPKIIIATLGETKKSLPKSFDLKSRQSCRGSPGKCLIKRGSSLSQEQATKINEAPTDSLSKSDMTHL